MFYCTSFLVILLNAININRYFSFYFVQTMLAFYFGLNSTAIIFQKGMSQSLTPNNVKILWSLNASATLPMLKSNFRKKSQAVHKEKRKRWDLKNSRKLKRCFKHHLLLLYYKWNEENPVAIILRRTFHEPKLTRNKADPNYLDQLNWFRRRS